MAGGSSTRMGQNKLEMELQGKTIINTVIDNALNSKLDEVVLVYGKYDVETDIKKIYNENYELGMSTSLIKGLEGYEGEAILILLGDMPFVSSEIINNILDGFSKSLKNIAIPVFEARKGNPVIIGKKYFKALLNNSGDKGGREIIKNNETDVEWVKVSSQGIFVDIDEKLVYERVCKELER